MPLLTDFPAGRTYERHRHGTAHSANLLGVGGFAVGTDDTLAAGEVLLLLTSDLTLFCFVLFTETSHFLTGGFAFTFYYAWIGEIAEIITIPTKEIMVYFISIFIKIIELCVILFLLFFYSFILYF